MKPTLRIQTVQMIEESDWSQFVSQVYGRRYRLQQQGGCYNRGVIPITVPSEYEYDDYPDTVLEIVNGPEMGVNFEAWLARDPNAFIKQKEHDSFPDPIGDRNLWWDRNFYPPLDVVADDLHKRGLLPAGEYYINIDW